MAKDGQDRENSDEYYSPGSVKERQKSETLDDAGATPLSSGEQAELDQIEAGFGDESSFYKGDGGESDGTVAEGRSKGRIRSIIGQGNKAKGKASGLKKRFKKKAKLIIGGVIIVFGIILIAVFLFVSSLKLPHMIANITAFEFSRLSRNFDESVSSVTEEKLALDSADESFTQSLRNKYGDFRSATWGKFDKFRPQKVLENMQSTGQLSYVFEEEPRLIKIPGFSDTKQVLRGVTIEGETIPFEQGRWFEFFSNRANRLEFSGELKGRLESALSESNMLVRGSVASKIREVFGIKLRRWDRLTKSYTDSLGSIRENTRITVDQTSTGPDSAGVDAIDNTLHDLQTQTDDTLKSDAELNKEITQRPAYQQAVDATIAKDTADTFATKLAGVGSTVYAIAVPLCLIFEGSVENSGKVVDKNQEQKTKTFYTVASAAHQQQAGGKNVDPVQIKGLNEEIGDITNTPEELRAGGKLTSTASYPNPQTGGAEYTLISTFFSGALGDMFNSGFKSLCPTITDPLVGVALTGAELALKAFTGGGEAGVTTVLQEFVDNIFTKDFAKALAFRVTRDVTLITAGTLLAKYIVITHMGHQSAPIPSGQDIAVSAAQGGNIHAGEVNRKQLYGGPMSLKDVAMSNYQDLQDIAYRNTKKSVFERYLSPNNPTSALANVAVGLDGSFRRPFTSTMRSIITKIGSIFQPNNSLMTILMSGNQKKALAATTDTNFGIVQWGWSPDEEALINGNPDLYSPLVNAQNWESKIPDLKGKYDKCFTESMGTLLSNKWIVRDNNGEVLPDEGDCAPNKLGPNNDEAFQYRLYMRYSNTLDQLSDVENPLAAEPASTTTPGTPAPPTGGTVTPPPVPIFGDTSNVPCAAGQDFGIADGWKNFQKFTIRICRVQGTVVNSQISKNIDDMYTAAHNAGILLTGGGFRTYSDQVGVYLAHCKVIGLFPSPPYDATSPHCPGAAIPGNSNHQMGFAIDFNCNGKLIPQRTPSPGTNVCFDWLLANANRYGLYEWGKGTVQARAKPGYEAWHWSVDGN